MPIDNLGTCPICGHPIWSGDDYKTLPGSGKKVHSKCAGAK